MKIVRKNIHILAIEIKLTCCGMMLKLKCVRGYWTPEEKGPLRLCCEHDSTLRRVCLRALLSAIPIDCTVVHFEVTHSRLVFMKTICKMEKFTKEMWQNKSWYERTCKKNLLGGLVCCNELNLPNGLNSVE